MLKRIEGSRFLSVLVAFAFALVLVLLLLRLFPQGAPRAQSPSLQPAAIRPNAASAMPAVSIQAKDTEVREILDSLARQVGAQLEVDAGITGKMSLVTRDSKFEDAMDAVCYSFNCSWQLDPGTRALLVRVRESDEPVQAGMAPGLS